MATTALKENAVGLASLVINLGDPGANNAPSVVDNNPNDNVSISSGRPELGDLDGVIDIDGKPGAEIIVNISDKNNYSGNKDSKTSKTSVDSDQKFVWNLKTNSFETVNIEITDVVGSMQKVSDYTGLPRGYSKSLAGAARRLPLKGTTAVSYTHLTLPTTERV